ncbi:hypothetical protein T484DRAFT_1784663 [Baffinella frigidus]|nr:hypothetical protein T484DRAFT_1784663 [Cryptophyta sp. CCMP2293]
MSEPGDEGAMEEGSNYTFRLHVAQLAGGGERTRRDLGRIAFRADELFEEEDALAAGAMAHVLKRFGDKTGFEVAAFEHGDTVIRDNTALDECLAAIEDAGFSTAGLSVGLRPVCEFRLFTDGTPEAVAVLKHEVATAKWEWMKKELFRISGGKDTAFRYTREGLRDGVLLPPTPVIVDDEGEREGLRGGVLLPQTPVIVDDEVSFVACLQHLLARDDGDFSIEAALIPAPTSVKSTRVRQS